MVGVAGRFGVVAGAADMLGIVAGPAGGAPAFWKPGHGAFIVSG
jgi:hypothetical protein